MRVYFMTDINIIFRSDGWSVNIKNHYLLILINIYPQLLKV